MPDYLHDPLAEVQRAYPNGVQGSERAALLGALADEMSERSIGDLM